MALKKGKILTLEEKTEKMEANEITRKNREIKH